MAQRHLSRRTFLLGLSAAAMQTAILAACTPTTPPEAPTPTVAKQEEPVATETVVLTESPTEVSPTEGITPPATGPTLRVFTREELAQYDGRDGRPVYVAYNGKVYDLSSSPLWRGGRHQARHDAGADMTEVLPLAPHGVEKLAKFPVVGILEE